MNSGLIRWAQSILNANGPQKTENLLKWWREEATCHPTAIREQNVRLLERVLSKEKERALKIGKPSKEFLNKIETIIDSVLFKGAKR